MPQKTLECSSRGDRRFSSYYARITINGIEDSVEHFYQKAKRRQDGRSASKSGSKYDHFICPYTGQKFKKEDAPDFFKGLWVAYFKQHPDLVEYAKGFDAFTDMFRDRNDPGCRQSDIITAYIKDNEQFMTNLRASRWYQNLNRYYSEVKATREAALDKNKPAAPNAKRPASEPYVDCEAILRDYANRNNAEKEKEKHTAVKKARARTSALDQAVEESLWLKKVSCSLDPYSANQPEAIASDKMVLDWVDSLLHKDKKAGKGTAYSKDEYAPITAKMDLIEITELFNDGSLRLEDVVDDLKDLLVAVRAAQEDL